jgi:NADH-quinone oxidoreductase subunit A
MELRGFGVVGVVALFVASIALLATAAVRRPYVRIHAPDSWKSYRFGFVTYALIFLAFDMEMIFMYPWAVVYGAIGLKALLDMLVFIALLGVGVSYAWRMGALRWE